MRSCLVCFCILYWLLLDSSNFVLWGGIVFLLDSNLNNLALQVCLRVQSFNVHNLEKTEPFSTHSHTHRISDLSKSLRKAAPLVVEKFQFGVEAQFAVMLFAVVFLFYLTWTAILVSDHNSYTRTLCLATSHSNLYVLSSL